MYEIAKNDSLLLLSFLSHKRLYKGFESDTDRRFLIH